MNKTVALKIKSNGAKGRVNVGAKPPTLASLLAQQTPEKKAATKAYIYEKLGKDEAYFALFDDIKKNKTEIINRSKLTWDDIKALQKAWKELEIPDSVEFKSNVD
jgi:hypothetical protein